MSKNINKLESFSQELFHLTKNWLDWDKNEETRKEILDLVENEKFDKLSSCMFGRLSFGTAGMRAPMSAGFNRLNDLTMIQTAQGFLRYLQKTFAPEVLQIRGIVVGHDARHNSQRFAHILTNVFARHSVKVNLFSKIVPTPFVSFAVAKLHCVAGAMVTASHNPKEDNGFKVYWSNGAQILSPHDQNICTTVKENLEPWAESWNVPCNIYEFSNFVVDPYAKILGAYMEQALSNCHFKISNTSTSLKFTYTPVHGVGYYFTPELLKQFGFKDDSLCYVKEQIMPDPNFPTAPFPNPEEGETVLVLAVGFLYLKRDKKFLGKASNVYVINSAVSSRIAGSIAKSEGFNYEETLTGFKWMANRAHELICLGKTVLLCWEESIGYLPGGLSLDKDGVLTAAIFAEYAAYLKGSMNNKGFADHLEFLYANSV
uniref:Phosphoglucomutase n=1 Tax=Romanomermis culicivorax TaxID=13658 RepID=A0A915KI78_ROMCU